MTRSRSRLGEMASEVPLVYSERHAKRARQVAVRLPGLVLLVLGFVTLRHLLASPRFTVGVVEVTGTQMLALDQVRADSRLLGRSVFSIDQRAVGRELMARYPCLEQASVSCRLPGTCRIRLAEVGQVVVWLQGNSSWWVAADGRVLGQATAAIGAPTLRNSGPPMLPQDGYLVGVPWQYALAVGQALPAGDEMEFVPGYGLVLRLGDEGLPVYLGTGGKVAAKLSLAAETMAEAKQRGMGLAYIDLRIASRPIAVGL